MSSKNQNLDQDVDTSGACTDEGEDLDPSAKSKKIVLRGNGWDFAYKMYLLVGGVYYALDSMLKFYYFGFTVFTDRCRQAFFIHHVMTIINF